jgi:citrate synthase
MNPTDRPTNTATLSVTDRHSQQSKLIELPVYPATLGEDVIDVGSVTKHDFFTYDPGFVSTASCESKITYIDGDKGVLVHRGYLIEELAAKASYDEVCFLLLTGELPTQVQKDSWLKTAHDNSFLPKSIQKCLSSLSPDAHPMSLLLTLMSVLSAHYQENQPKTPEERFNVSAELVAKIPMLVAMIYRHITKQSYIPYDPNRCFAENFLHMTFGKDEIDPILVKAMDTIFTLHADHEQNASTSTVRMVGSTGSNPAACVAAGISALWGPAHGGANEACLKMLGVIGDVSRIPEYITKAKDKNDSFRLMGFGHRVYKNFDPRAKIMQKVCHDVLNVTGTSNEPLFKLATELAKVALEDNYFIEKKLYPNVDYYSGVTLKAIGIPTSMFTTIFSLARTVGWMSHWCEMVNEPYKIARPRQLYTGQTQRPFVEIKDR